MADAKPEAKEKYLNLRKDEYKGSINQKRRQELCDLCDIKVPTSYHYDKFLGNGEYNSDQYLEDKTKVVDAALILACEKGSPQALMTYFKRTGKIVEKREDSVKVEFTSADRIQVAVQLRDALRREYENTGSCPVCQRYKALCDQPYLDKGREQTEDSEVEALAVSTRPN